MNCTVCGAPEEHFTGENCVNYLKSKLSSCESDLAEYKAADEKSREIIVELTLDRDSLASRLSQLEVERSMDQKLIDAEQGRIKILVDRLDSIREALHLPATTTHEGVLHSIRARQNDYDFQKERLVERRRRLVGLTVQEDVNGCLVSSKDVPGLHLIGSDLAAMEDTIVGAIKRLVRDNDGYDARVVWRSERELAIIPESE